jgi:mono/diheme cytochrome c family protein
VNGFVIAVALAAFLSFPGSAAERPKVPWERNPQRVGRALYREHCVVCHDIDTAQSKKLGPSFFQLFKREKMPLSNAKPNREYVKVRVRFGGPLMPAFRKWLNDRDIDTLIDYIASPRENQRP